MSPRRIPLRLIRIRVLGGDGGESNSPSRELPARIYYRLIQYYFSLPGSLLARFHGSQPIILIPSLSA